MQVQVHPTALKHCGEVRLQYFDDGKDGFLTIAEENVSIPFSIKRVYYIS
jgi:WxcM-like, C-terminal